MDRGQKTLAVLVFAAVLGMFAWFFRYQPLPTAAAAAVQNRWTGTIYVVNAKGRLVRVVDQGPDDQ